MGVENVKLRPSTVTFGGVALGCTDGDLEITLPTLNSVDITCHQEGSNVLDQIVTGYGPLETTVVIKEVTLANLEKLLEEGLGGSFTPVAGTKVIGFGKDKQFQSLLALAQELRFSPVGALDNTNDFVFWKAIPIMESVTRSGENPEVASVTFRVYPDATKQDAINIVKIYGDDSQNLDA